MVDLMCSLVSWFCFALHLFLPTNLCLTGSLAGIAPCSFALPRLGFVINLFCILLSGRSAVGNMSVGGLKPHVLGELELGICFSLSIFDILSWKATEISSFRLSLEFCVISQHEQNHWGTLFSSGVSAISMAPIRFFACLIILALSAGAADTNSTDTVDALQTVSWENLTENKTTTVNLRGAVMNCCGQHCKDHCRCGCR